MGRPRYLTARQDVFLDYVMMGYPAYKAYEMAGYKSKGKTAMGAASRLLSLPYIAAELERRRRERRELLFRQLESVGEEAVAKLMEILRSGDAPAVKLAAAREVLDRIGLKPPEEKRVSGELRITVKRKLNDRDA